MANKIQLRRDTAANWTRVNPILDDGEPGVETDTNKVKYGDGNTTWISLEYASGGLSLEYAGFQEGPGVMSGNVTSLTGSVGTGLSLTADGYSQMMWVPDASAVTINEIDDGGNVYNWAYVDDSGFTVTSADFPDSYEWKFNTNGNLNTPGEVVIESNNAHGGAGYAGVLTFTNTTDGSTNPNKYIRLNSTGNLEIVDSGYANTIMSLSDGGNLTVKGSISSNAGTGNVTLQASDGSNPRNFVFDTDGSISLPHLATGSQGVGAFNAVNNLIALTSGDTVNFANFSGMILVNTHNGGGVTMYLCGGGTGNAVAIGDSKAGNSVGAMAHNAGIGGYTFTADETGDHVFCAIRTRTGA